MKKLLIFLFDNLIILSSYQLMAQPSNDSCRFATYIIVDQTCDPDTFDNIGATDEGTMASPNPTCGFYTGKDVWFNFVVPSSGNVQVEVRQVSTFNPAFELYEGRCGNFTLYSCNNNDYERTISDTSLAGDTLTLRVWRRNNMGEGTFSLCIFEPDVPSNNDCENAIFISTDSICLVDTFSNKYSTEEDTSIARDPDCGFFRGGDVWFQTVMPPSGELRLEVFKINGPSQSFEFYSGSCGSFTQLGCNRLNGDRTFVDSNLIGDTITIRTFAYLSNDGGDFTLCSWDPPVPPNNNCNQAIYIPVLDSCSAQTFTNAFAEEQDTSVAQDPSCGFYLGGDVWFKTVVPPTGLIRFESSRMTLSWTAYRGQCGSFSEIFCSQLDKDQTFQDSADIGDTIYLRMHDYNSEEGSPFDLCLYEPDYVLNDNCANAFFLDHDTNYVFSDSCSWADDTYATSQDISVAPNPSCGFYKGGDVWFKTIVPSSGYLFIESSTTKEVGVYAGKCSQLTEIDCEQGDYRRTTYLPDYAGDTVYLRVWTYNNEEGGLFFIKLFEPTNFPVNDLCANAIPLSSGQHIFHNAFSSTDSVGTAPDPNCGFYRGSDVWFTYAVPSNGEVRLEMTNINAGINPQVQLLTGTCGNFTQYSCYQNPTAISFTDAGLSMQTIYVRVYSYNDRDGGSFGLCAYDTACTPIQYQVKDRYVCDCDELELDSNEILSVRDRYISQYEASDGSDLIIVWRLKYGKDDYIPFYYLGETCAADSFTFPDGYSLYILPFATQVYHLANWQNQFGCDSVILYSVDVRYNYTQEVDSVCFASDYYTPTGDTIYNVVSNFIDTSVLIDSKGCDSLIYTQVNVRDTSIFYRYHYLCVGDTFTWPNGDTLNTDSAVSMLLDTSVFSNRTGCDSTYISWVGIYEKYSTNWVDSICRGDDFSFSGVNLTNVQKDTMYQIPRQSARGCDSIVEVQLNIIFVDTGIYKYDTYELRANDTLADGYQWLNCDDNSLVSGATSYIFGYGNFPNGYYRLVIEKNGCIDTSGCLSYMPGGIGDNEFERSIKIYPNSTRDDVAIEFETVQKAIDISLYDANNRLILERSETGSKRSEVSLAELANGIYYVVIRSGKQNARLRIVKE